MSPRAPGSAPVHAGRHARILVLAIAAATLALAPAALAAGTPYTAPVVGQAVYDEAGVLSAAVESRVEATIDAIESRTGAEIVVYTRLVAPGVTPDQAELDAQALMDQWGVGRRGIDDGLVILFDLHRTDPCHGQVQLYAGPGYRAAYLSNEERQAIFENDMLPLLRACDPDGALLAAMAKIDANATTGHANTLEAARQGNAVLGLVVAPLVLILVVGGGLLAWYRSGRDPVYLDDPSILVPAPPPGLTPAAGAAVRDGRVARRALTAASLDLAVRGLSGFRAEPPALLGRHPRLGIVTGEAASGDAAEQARMIRARRRPMDAATQYLAGQLASVAGASGYIPPDRITELGQYVGTFNTRLESHLVSEGWYRERPSRSVGRWAGRGVLVFIGGVAAFVAAVNLPSDGLLLVGLALVVSAVALWILSAAMPARTRAGAVIRAMLEAYRRTLERTMAQAASMGEVVATSAIPLIESPDDAVAWGVALGLQDEVERVLERSARAAATGGAGAYLPAWYLASGGGGAFGGPGGGTGSGWAPGLMSSSPVPDFGGMMAALGTIGNSPASSGSGGGGGFGGGGSGGGGGGAGGGF